MTTRSSPPPPPPGLPEIPEAGAPDTVAALYRDIRATLGVDLVNLVYRHLATVPGALAWAWGLLAPHFRSGAIDAQAQALRSQVQRDIANWAPAFAGIGAAGPVRADAEALVRAYNLNNSRNLLALQHLLCAGNGAEGRAPRADGAKDGATEGTAQPLPPVQALPPLPPLPPLPAWSALHSAAQATVMRLNRLGEPAEPAIVASLYRHLALWPALLDTLEPALTGLDARGRMASALAHTVRTAQAIAQATPLAMPQPAPATVDAALRARLQVFADVTIPKMLPVGLALEAALAPLP